MGLAAPSASYILSYLLFFYFSLLVRVVDLFFNWEKVRMRIEGPEEVSIMRRARIV